MEWYRKRNVNVTYRCWNFPLAKLSRKSEEYSAPVAKRVENKVKVERRSSTFDSGNLISYVAVVANYLG